MRLQKRKRIRRRLVGESAGAEEPRRPGMHPEQEPPTEPVDAELAGLPDITKQLKRSPQRPGPIKPPITVR